jgi:cyanate permease
MSVAVVDRPELALKNEPRALPMALIAFINQNVAIACTFGSFSVLLGAVESRLGVGRELSTLGVPILALASALLAPVAGALAARFSLRLVMLAGAVLSVAGFALLAVSSSFPLYLAAYGLLLGPGMAVGVVLPPTLVTRWYAVNSGRALGIVTAPIVITLMPLAATWALQSFGLPTTYGMLAGLSGVSLLANLFIVDRPPGSEGVGAAPGGEAAAAGGRSMAKLLRSATFWSFAIAFAASGAGSIILTSHMAPMARSWGFSAGLAASLLSIMSFVGIAGNILFGWLADRIGGARALAFVVFDAAVLWALLLLHPPFVLTAVIIGLIGLHGSGAIPALSVALSEAFGREAFSGAFGLANLINLPFSVICVPAAALVYARTGSYFGAILGQAAFLILAGLLVLAISLRAAAAKRSGRQSDGPEPKATGRAKRPERGGEACG